MIAIGSDHGGFELKKEIMAHLDARGLEYKDFGTYSDASCDYPVYGKAVANAVASGECERGIIICGTGIGISITANKVHGIRAALCGDCFSAEATVFQQRAAHPPHRDDRGLITRSWGELSWQETVNFTRAGGKSAATR